MVKGDLKIIDTIKQFMGTQKQGYSWNLGLNIIFWKLNYKWIYSILGPRGNCALMNPWISLEESKGTPHPNMYLLEKALMINGRIEIGES